MDPLFKGYVSNTLAAYCAQNVYTPGDPEKLCVGRVFYRLFAGGEYKYRLYFGNLIDSTFGLGEYSHPNDVCDSWQIESAKVAVCPPDTDIANVTFERMQALSFDGRTEKTVMPGEIFRCDELVLKAEKNDYLCLEIAFRGTRIPYLAESHATIPTFRLEENGWRANGETPGAFLVGCDRRVKKHVAFLGDSITMGCGTPQNKYLYWVARVGEMLGEEYACWNLGIGFARCSDAATDGAWLYKAKQADLVHVCLGTNDLLWNNDKEKVVEDLHRVVDKLREAKCEVGLFTAPPFDYRGETAEIWRRVNERICKEFPEKTKYIFDLGPILSKPAPEDGVGKYKAHPNAEGCQVIAESFVAFAKETGIF